MSVTPYMEKGGLYRLRNMSKNKHHQCLTANKHYIENNVPVLQPCRAYGWPGPNAKRYRDGDLFLCVKVLEGRSYILLSPDGKQVSLWHDRNKTKFARVK